MPDTLKRCSAASENRLHFIEKQAPLYPQSRLHIRAMEPVSGWFGISFPMPRSIFFDEMLGGFIHHHIVQLMDVEKKEVFYDRVGAFMAAEAKGRAEGRAEGAIETNRENAKKMKAKGYAIDEITEITGLTAEEIAQL